MNFQLAIIGKKGIDMANLAGRTTNGETAWDKYVRKNRKWKELTLFTENNTSLFMRKGANVSEITEIPEGTGIKLADNRYTMIVGKKFANVKVGYKNGLIPLTDIKKPTNFKPSTHEEEVVNIINKVISMNQGIPIDVRLKGDSIVYKDISGAMRVDASVRRIGGKYNEVNADIILYKNEQDLLDENNIYISHKKEGGPDAFQQYCGLSKAAGMKIHRHPETQKFLEAVSKNIEDGKLRNPMFMRIRSPSLKNMSIYGPEFSSTYGLDHVQVIGQGLPRLTLKSENLYELDFTSRMNFSGELTHFGSGYVPVFGATYREDTGRGFEYNGDRFTGARVGIYPLKMIVKRNDVVEVK